MLTHPRTRTHLVLAVLVLCPLLVPAGADAARRKPAATCKAKGSKTVLAAGSYRVYTKRGPKRPRSADPSTVTSLCGARGRGKAVTIAKSAVYSAGTLGFRLPQLAGKFASAVTTSDDRGGYSEELEVFDIRRRRRTSVFSPTAGSRFRDVVLTGSGNIAWIRTSQSPGQDPNAEPVFNSFEVGARVGGKNVVLDTGAAVAPSSLAYSGGIVYWANGQNVGTAKLP